MGSPTQNTNRQLTSIRHYHMHNILKVFSSCKGNTDDYHAMLLNLLNRHPNTKLVCVGFSLGGNLVTKYLGEKDRVKHPNIIGGISICQGYNAIE